MHSAVSSYDYICSSADKALDDKRAEHVHRDAHNDMVMVRDRVASDMGCDM